MTEVSTRDALQEPAFAKLAADMMQKDNPLCLMPVMPLIGKLVAEAREHGKQEERARDAKERNGWQRSTIEALRSRVSSLEETVARLEQENELAQVNERGATQDANRVSGDMTHLLLAVRNFVVAPRRNASGRRARSDLLALLEDHKKRGSY